jgi:hypothetical protein
MRLFHFFDPAQIAASLGSLGQLWFGRQMNQAKKARNKKEIVSVQTLCSAKKVSPGML